MSIHEFHGMVNGRKAIVTYDDVNDKVSLTDLINNPKSERGIIYFSSGITLRDIIETEKKLEEVDVLLEEISWGEGCELYGVVLRKWYIDKVPKERIGEEIGYRERNIYYLKGC